MPSLSRDRPGFAEPVACGRSKCLPTDQAWGLCCAGIPDRRCERNADLVAADPQKRHEKQRSRNLASAGRPQWTRHREV